MAASSCDRGRGKNKQYWNDEEAEALVDVLQELASDPLWKVDGGFKNNYMVEVHKLDLVWGRDRATGLKAEDISQACEDTNNKKNVLVCSSSDSDDEVFMVPETQDSPITLSGTHATKKRKKLSPIREIVHKKKKSVTLHQTIDTKLDNLTSKFESICGQMASQYGVAANALTAEANKSKSMSDEKMQEVINELLNVGISQVDVGKAAEVCYNDPAKVKVLFALPSHMQRSYVLGFLYSTD